MSTAVAEPEVFADQATQPAGPQDYRHAVTPAAAVTDAYLNQTYVTALCGYTWIPRRNPHACEMCPRCAELLLEISNPVNIPDDLSGLL